MATITVRAIDPITFDPQQGNGQSNFISDLAAVVQIINTRLRLFQGEWFLNLLDGLPMFSNGPSTPSILGSSGNANNIEVIINMISARISGSPYVTSLGSVYSTYQNRQFKYSALVNTPFGSVVVNNSPGSIATLEN